MNSYASVSHYMNNLIMVLKQVAANQLQKRKFPRRLAKGHTLSASISIKQSTYAPIESWSAAVTPPCPLSSSPCCLLSLTGLNPTAPWSLPLVHDSKPWILLPDHSGDHSTRPDQASCSLRQAGSRECPSASRSIGVIENSSSE